MELVALMIVNVMFFQSDVIMKRIKFHSIIIYPQIVKTNKACAYCVYIYIHVCQFVGYLLESRCSFGSIIDCHNVSRKLSFNCFDVPLS